MAIDTALTEMAGVYYVAYQLSAHGYTVALTPDRTKAFDLVALNTESGESWPVQVKTSMNARKRRRSYAAWTAGGKVFANRPKGPAFVILVDLCGGPSESKPSIAYVIPWGEWENDAELRVQYGSGNWFNILDRHESKFRERWDLIKPAIA